MFKYQKGNSDIAFFLGFFVLLFFLWWASGGAQKGANDKSKTLISIPKSGSAEVSSGKSSSKSSVESGDGETKYNQEGEPLSPWQGQITIASLGTAKGEYDPDLEYIILRAKGNKEPINITGWSLLNGRNRNPVALDISQDRGVANQVYLPEGRSVYLVSGLDTLQPIKLAAGTEAIVTTGKAPRAGSYRASFRTNICLGYLEEDDDKFYPALKIKCPNPEVEPGIEFVNEECRDFIADLASCHTPEFERSRVDGVSGLSSSCRNYLEDHYSYRGCVTNHLSDKNFYGTQWRVYLNRPWEMWAKGNEVITLLDDRGLVVDRKSY